MALYRPATAPWQAGAAMNGAQKSASGPRVGTAFRMYDQGKGEQKGHGPLVRTRSGRLKKSARARSRQCSIGALVVILLVILVVSLCGTDFAFAILRAVTGTGSVGLPDLIDKQELLGVEGAQGLTAELGSAPSNGHSREFSSILKKNQNVKEDLGFWDKAQSSKERPRDLDGDDSFARISIGTNVQDRGNRGWQDDLHTREQDADKDIGAYNERGRKELRIYEEEFEASLKKELNLSRDKSGAQDGQPSKSLGPEQKLEMKRKDSPEKESVVVNSFSSPEIQFSVEGANIVDVIVKSRKGGQSEDSNEERNDSDDDEYDDDGEDTEFVHYKDSNVDISRTDQDWQDDGRIENGESHGNADNESNETDSRDPGEAKRPDGKLGKSRKGTKRSSSKKVDGGMQHSIEGDGVTVQVQEKENFIDQKPSKGRRKSKHAAVPCEMNFLNTTKGLKEPPESAKFENFSLNFVLSEEIPIEGGSWKPHFAGHQTLEERESSFLAKDQTLHCGFVEGPKGSPATGFELSETDYKYLDTCHIAVSSCIFGNYDHIRNPLSKKVSTSSKKKVCFAMFVDQKSLDGMIEDGEIPDENMYIGLWRILLIKNMPYTDGRRTGKVPKFLTHRLFPNARYSIWLDSKLRLQSDPLLILEYFLWRGGHEYAISNHYDRHCVWEEVAQNKRLNKYNHSVIDEQFAFYRGDGLIQFNSSDPKKILPSHVPEGSFIARAHTPMSNLFSCLWFNEANRFTPRDQLSFFYTFLKLVRMNPLQHFYLNMFKDCERKAMAKLFRHKPQEGATEQ